MSDGAPVARSSARNLGQWLTSLSLPFNLDGVPIKGEKVGFFFDNLLPDSQAIRQRVRARFHTRSGDAFDLLQAIGRDRAGALQLLPEGESPVGTKKIAVTPVTDREVEALLLAATSPASHTIEDDLRISIAGAQEKTALTRHEGRWCKPHGATPTAVRGSSTHARVLEGSDTRDEDLASLMRAQLLYWMLAATDGHAKNLSIRLLAGGRYRLTPLYDVLSASPVSGTRANQVHPKKLKLAMAVRGAQKHYRIADIGRRHFNATARLCGLGKDMDSVIDDVGARLPKGFPMHVFDAITKVAAGAIQRV